MTSLFNALVCIVGLYLCKEIALRIPDAGPVLLVVYMGSGLAVLLIALDRGNRTLRDWRG